jgi:hypothetical protein
VPAFDSGPIVEARKGGEANRTIYRLRHAKRGPGETDRPGLRPPIPAGVTRVFKQEVPLRYYILLESTMSKLEKLLKLPGSLYRWSFVLLPVLALVLSACTTGGTGGGYGY